jgi:hypothetical protein
VLELFGHNGISGMLLTACFAAVAKGGPMTVISTSLSRHLSIARWIVGVLEGGIKLPLIGKRIGLDPVIGLVPVIGDWVGLVLGLYVVWVAAGHQVPGHIVGRMVRNLMIDAALGLVPVAGDVFDFFWKANRANLKLLEDAVAQGLHHAPNTARVLDEIPTVIDVSARQTGAKTG